MTDVVRIRESFAGARVLVTGASGFLGTALVSKILTSLPDIEELMLLVRSKPGAPAPDRVRRRILGSNAFEHLRADGRLEGLEAKIRTLDGDLRSERLGLSDDDLVALGRTDIVLHSAASVDFDAPVDEAYETNLMGALRLLDTLRSSGANPRRIVHISTAYVAGLSKGHIPEVESARLVRQQVEYDSRSPERASEFEKRARREIGPAGAPAVAAKAEQFRREWVTERLVEMGRGRARSLGWPDAYTLTKSLAETAVLARASEDGLPLSILRPSIIESALREPFPGWIRGFRMTDPIIIAYGRGQIPEFPGIPDAVVDVVPVDLVVNGALALAATPDPPRVIHVSTGARNPLYYRDLVRWTHEYFHRHPYFDEDGQPILPPLWTFPGKRSVERRLQRGLRLLKTASSLLDHLPQSRFGETAHRIDDRLGELKQIEKYAQLYGGYAEAEAIFDDRNAQALLQRLDPAERELFSFDAGDVDWKSYLQENHLPEITRRRGTVRRRPRPAPRSEVKAGGQEVLAVFDLEGTVLGTNVVDTYLWMRLAASPRREWSRRIADLASDVPRLLASERRDRGEFLRRFYRRYKGAPVEEIARVSQEVFHELILPRAFPEALRRIREHRSAGHRVVFLTGALDFTVEPLAPLADVVAAARMRVEDDRYTGELTDVPYAGDARAAYLRRLAEELGADLRASYAYADSLSDLPMLESVAHPVAVNPDARLARVARDRRWAIEQWSPERGPSRFPLPEVSRT